MIRTRLVSDQLKAVRGELDALNSMREEAIVLTRRWLSICRASILRARKMENLDCVEEELRILIGEVKAFLQKCQSSAGYIDPTIESVVSDAVQEAVEGIVLARLLRKEPVPYREDLSVGPKEYVLGIADAIGELRRVALQFLLNGKTSEAEQLVTIMEEMYENLNSMVFPDSFLPVRRKADLARSLIEKTLSEILMMKASMRRGKE